jgi:hypothetical protein
MSKLYRAAFEIKVQLHVSPKLIATLLSLWPINREEFDIWDDMGRRSNFNGAGIRHLCAAGEGRLGESMGDDEFAVEVWDAIKDLPGVLGLEVAMTYLEELPYEVYAFGELDDSDKSKDESEDEDEE